MLPPGSKIGLLQPFVLMWHGDIRRVWFSPLVAPEFRNSLTCSKVAPDIRTVCSPVPGVAPEIWFFLRPNSWTKVSRFFLLAIHSHLYSFAMRFLFLQTHATSYSFYSLVTVHCNENMKYFPYGLRNPYRNLKSENSPGYARKAQQNGIFMNSAFDLLILSCLWDPVLRLPKGCP
jgi:hypothetical protein